MAQLRAAGQGLDFRSQLWPLIAKEVESVYYQAVLTRDGRGADAADFVEQYLAADGMDAEAKARADFGITECWDWHRIAFPYGSKVFTNREQYHDWLLGYLADDLAAAEAGNVSGPLKAAVDALRDLRNEVRLAVDHAGLTVSPTATFWTVGTPR